MSDIYEQAAESMPSPFDALAARSVAAAVWTAQYGCPQCNGTRWQHGDQTYDCPAEHVVLVNPHSRETVHCDPSLTMGWCIIHEQKRDEVSVRLEIGPICHAGGLIIRDTCEFVEVAKPYEGSSDDRGG